MDIVPHTWMTSYGKIWGRDHPIANPLQSMDTSGSVHDNSNMYNPIGPVTVTIWASQIIVIAYKTLLNVEGAIKVW